jgi:toxin YoeB
LHQVLGQESRDFSIRLKSLITNSITRFESPLIRDDEHVQKEELELNSEYFINDTQCCTGLACADIWGTFCVSFLTSELWESDKIQITKHHIIDDESIVEIPNVSKQEHTLTLNFDQKSKLESVEELFDTLSSQDSQYLLEFSKDAYSDIYALYDTNHSIINRFYDLLSSIKSTPDVGIGKPEKLKEDKSGYLSRRVNLEDRIVYKQVSADTIEIISCKGHYD